MLKAAEHHDALIPIRIEFEAQGHYIRDSFTWNRNGERARRSSIVEL